MRQPFEVSVGELLQAPGTIKLPGATELNLSGPLDGVVLESSATRLADTAEVRFDGFVEAQGAQVIVRGAVSAPWTGECRRCLERVTPNELEVELHEIFEEHPVEDETFPLENDTIDLAPVLRQALTLELPFAPLCSEACRGPLPDEFDVTEPPPDPRWAVLDQLDFGSS